MFDKATVLKTRESNPRERAITLYAAVQQIMYEQYIKALGDYDKFVECADKLNRDIRDGEYIAQDGNTRPSFKPFLEQIRIFNEEYGMATWTDAEIEELAKRYHVRKEERSNQHLQSGTYEDRQQFQTVVPADQRPEYANSDVYTINRLEEDIKDTENRIERLNNVTNLSRNQALILDNLNQRLVKLYDQLRAYNS